MEDLLFGDEIVSKIQNPAVKLILKDTTGSTNTDLMKLAAQGAPEFTLIVAAEQTTGKGTRGRHFLSPKGTGVYFSLLLRPVSINMDFVFSITPAAAVAAARAVDTVFGVKTGIKWVNDLILNGKKIAGILTEASSGFVVCGIGVNISPPPDGFTGLDSAGAVTDSPPRFAREHIVAETINQFLELYGELEERTFLEEYRERSVLIGRDVTVMEGNTTYIARVQGISADFMLSVVKQNGAQKNLSYGEVSVKL